MAYSVAELRLSAGAVRGGSACITAAAAKLPPVTALKIERSRVVAQPSVQGQRNSKLYHVRVEIDASVAGQTSTYVFNCVRDGQLTVIQPVGMR